MNYRCGQCKEEYPMKFLALCCALGHFHGYWDENSLNYHPEFQGKNIMPLVPLGGKCND